MNIKRKKFLLRSEVKDRYLEAFLRDIKTDPKEVFNNLRGYLHNPYLHNYEFEEELDQLFNVPHIISELCPRDGIFCSFGDYNLEDGVCKYYPKARDSPKYKSVFGEWADS